MNKNQKMIMSAAALAVLASSVSGACSAQSESLSQMATDLTDDVSTTFVDGDYTGSAASTRWGDVQVSVVIADGSIADIQFLTYPDDDSRSAQINAQATVALVQEAIARQSSSVQVISGATFTSEAFMQSLDDALAQAI